MHTKLHRVRGLMTLVRDATGAVCLASAANWQLAIAVPATNPEEAATTAASQPAHRHVDIPAMDVIDALRELGRQTRAQIIAPITDLRGIHTRVVSGDFTAAEAAREMLVGTGLRVQEIAASLISIRRANRNIPPQEAADETVTLSEVVVTGSRLGRSNPETSQPAITTGGEEVRSRAVSNAAEVLEQTPGYATSSANVGANQTPFGVGQTFVDFLGLGSQRTLTLVNGRRHVSSNAATGLSLVEPGQQVDLGLIPIDLIERIETLAIGGAPVYGSDAISGTLNIILKDRFEGLKVRAQSGISTRCDAPNEFVSVLAGHNFGDDRGNALISLQYSNQSGLQENDRSYLQYGRGISVPNNGIPSQLVLPDRVLASITDGGIPVPPSSFGDLPPGTRGTLLPGYPNGLYVFDAAGHPLQFGSDGTLVPLSVGRGSSSPLLAQRGLLDAPLFLSGGDGLRGEHLSLLARNDRLLFNSLGHFDFAPGVQGFFELSYAHAMGEEREIVAPYGVAFSAGANIPMSVDNPFLVAQDRQVLLDNGLSRFGLSKNLSDITDTHPGNSVQQLYRSVVGLKGTIEAGEQPIRWDAAFNYGRTRARSELFYVNQRRLLAAVDAVRNASGDIVCASGARGCVPIDLFGSAHESPEAIAYVSAIGKALSTNTQRVTTLNVGSDFLRSRSVPVSLNIGFEHRREDADFDPDALMRAGNFSLPPIAPVKGSFSTQELYGELLIPVILPANTVLGINSLSFEGAARHVDNSLAGAATTWSIGSHFEPRLGSWSTGLILRGALAHSVRAPAATELFLPPSTGRTSAEDPCDSRFYLSGPHPAVRAANCAAALEPYGVAPARFTSLIVDNPRDGIDGAGNRNLRNETADAWSIGFVHHPSSLPMLSVSADWIHIQLRSGVEDLTLTQILDACYDSPAYPSPAACSAFVRGSGLQTGQIAQYRSGFINSSVLGFAGLLGEADYTLDLGSAGTLRLGTRVSHIAKFRHELIAGVAEDLRGEVGYPSYELSEDIEYRVGRWNALLRTNWISPVKLDNSVSRATLPINDVGAYTISNLTVGFNVTSRVRAQLLINNLFDREPPSETILQPTDIRRRAYDRIGRTFTLSLFGTF